MVAMADMRIFNIAADEKTSTGDLCMLVRQGGQEGGDPVVAGRALLTLAGLRRDQHNTESTKLLEEAASNPRTSPHLRSKIILSGSLGAQAMARLVAANADLISDSLAARTTAEQHAELARKNAEKRRMSPPAPRGDTFLIG